jgi:pimeloyl-ACP methyl ester carboxylesterase
MSNRYFSMAKDVKDVAKALKLTKIIVSGWSLGGMVSQTVMTKNSLY